MFGHENRTKHLHKCVIETLYKVSKGDSNPWLCCKVGWSNINVRIWKSNPWLMCCGIKYWSKKYFLIIIFFFYTLVMGFVHYGAVIIAYYETVHCLVGHHKFCWSSLHRCMRSVWLYNLSETGVWKHVWRRRVFYAAQEKEKFEIQYFVLVRGRGEKSVYFSLSWS